MSRSLRDYDFSLPEELIAREPRAHREDARMMLVDRATGAIEHRVFRDLPALLEPGDLAVLNDTRVIPARVMSDDEKIELFFLSAEGALTWKCMVRPGRRMRIGHHVLVGGIKGTVTAMCEDGSRVVTFEQEVDLNAVGRIPLPPYIRREPKAVDAERYQTVFASVPGAVAAPTAGLHFTPAILSRVPHVFLTLHVGPGTFRPVQVDDITEHRMHSERFRISPETATAIAAAKRVLAVGTTTARVLETCMRREGAVMPQESSTDIFIYPPFEFRAVGRLLTNFHLPKSTLLMLVSAFAGSELIREAYARAIDERYRFYSYGDCMLIL